MSVVVNVSVDACLSLNHHVFQYTVKSSYKLRERIDLFRDVGMFIPTTVGAIFLLQLLAGLTFHA